MEQSTFLNEVEDSTINFSNFIKILKQNIDCETEKFNKKIQQILLSFYLKTDKNYINLNFIDKNTHHIEFYNNEKKIFFTIYYSKKDIHIVIEDLEMIYFFDDHNFKNNYKIILKDLFCGSYIVKSSYKNDKLIRQELQFNDSNLSEFSIRNEFNYFFNFLLFNKNITHAEKKGICWIKN